MKKKNICTIIKLPKLISTLPASLITSQSNNSNNTIYCSKLEWMDGGATATAKMLENKLKDAISISKPNVELNHANAKALAFRTAFKYLINRRKTPESLHVTNSLREQTFESHSGFRRLKFFLNPCKALHSEIKCSKVSAFPELQILQVSSEENL